MEFEELLENNKTLMAQWDYEKNNSIGLDPTQLTTHSHKKAYWICENGHSFQRVINQAVNNMKCPVCTNKQVLKGYNDLETKFPEIAAEWDYENNNGLKPSDVLCGTNTKAAWVCSICGNKWVTKISKRTKEHSGCPKCGIQKSQQTRRNNVANGVTLPENLLNEWDYEKNKGIDPLKVSTQSGMSVGWICPNGHHYNAKIQNRFKGSGCPVCSNRELLIGFNDLATTHPEIAAQWDYDKNEKSPKEYMANSRDKVYWKCDKCGNSWQASCSARVYGHNGCPICARSIRTVNGQRLNVLRKGGITNEILLKEWDYDMNNGRRPEEYSSHSDVKVYWKCSKCGGVWQATINDRSKHHKSCPYCSNRIALKGFNDLPTLLPEILKEWDYDKNTTGPENYTPNSGKKVFWKCPIGHSYKAAINFRMRGGGCPICASGQKTSFKEQTFYYYIKKFYKDAINRYTDIFENKMELDIFIPSINVGIEYDGKYWHNLGDADNIMEREQRKYDICKQNGIKLIRILEENDESRVNSADSIYVLEEYYKNLDTIISEVIRELLTIQGKDQIQINKIMNDVVIDVDKDRYHIKEYEKGIVPNNLKEMRPDIAGLWDYEKNGDNLPEMYSVGSNEKFYFKCPKCGRSWEKTINAICRQKEIQCPMCSIGKERGHTPEKRPVIQYDKQGNELKVWDSASDAARELGIDRRSISRVAEGERKTYQGYVWKYTDED